jgi:hypothetical protein
LPKQSFSESADPLPSATATAQLLDADVIGADRAAFERLERDNAIPRNSRVAQ